MFADLPPQITRWTVSSRCLELTPTRSTISVPTGVPSGSAAIFPSTNDATRRSKSRKSGIEKLAIVWANRAIDIRSTSRTTPTSLGSPVSAPIKKCTSFRTRFRGLASAGAGTNHSPSLVCVFRPTPARETITLAVVVSGPAPKFGGSSQRLPRSTEGDSALQVSGPSSTLRTTSQSQNAPLPSRASSRSSQFTAHSAAHAVQTGANGRSRLCGHSDPRTR